MTKILGPKVSYLDMLDYAMSEKIKKDAETFRFNPLRPSSAGKCTKQLGYELMEFKGKATYPDKPLRAPNIQRLLNLGHSVEYSALKNFQYNLSDLFKIKYKQQSVTFFHLDNGQLIEGAVDAVFWSDEIKCLMDVKSTGNRWSNAYTDKHAETLAKFEKMSSCVRIAADGEECQEYWVEDLRAFIKEVNDPFLADNLYQLNGYASTEFFKERQIDHCLIYKYVKDNSKHWGIRFKVDHTLMEDLKDKFNAVADAVDKNDVESLVRDYPLGSMRCSFCPYASTCYGDDDTRKAFFATLPPKRWPKDIGRLDDTQVLVESFDSYEDLVSTDSQRASLEQKIILELQNKKIEKIKLDNGNVYLVKYLKSINYGKGGFVLRRSKT